MYLQCGLQEHKRYFNAKHFKKGICFLNSENSNQEQNYLKKQVFLIPKSVAYLWYKDPAHQEIREGSGEFICFSGRIFVVPLNLKIYIYFYNISQILLYKIFYKMSLKVLEAYDSCKNLRH